MSPERFSPPHRLAEYLMSLSLAIDMGMGEPPEWVMKAALLGTRLAEWLTQDRRLAAEVFYVVLLRHVGCSATATTEAEIFSDEREAHRVFPFASDRGNAFEGILHVVRHLGERELPIRRLGLLWKFLTAGYRLDLKTLSDEHCEIAETLARRMNLPSEIGTALMQAYERFDGSGQPRGLAGDAIAVSSRIATVALDASLFFQVGGRSAVEDLLADRTGRVYDPQIVELVRRKLDESFEALNSTSIWSSLLAAEPLAHRTVRPEASVEIFKLFADFADLKSPWFLGQSRRLYGLVSSAGGGLLGKEELELVQSAALVSGMGRVGVSSSIWGKKTALNDDEREAVRLYPYWTQRFFSRSSSLNAVGRLAASVQERLDGSGYPHGVRSLPIEARFLSAAHAFVAMTSDRPHRAAMSAEEAALVLEREVKNGLWDRECVESILATQGWKKPIPLPPVPFDLTPRELDVLRLLASGRTNKEASRKLGISAKTYGHHVERLYEKIGVRTRAGATLFAVNNSLLK